MTHSPLVQVRGFVGAFREGQFSLVGTWFGERHIIDTRKDLPDNPLEVWGNRYAKKYSDLTIYYCGNGGISERF